MLFRFTQAHKYTYVFSPHGTPRYHSCRPPTTSRFSFTPQYIPNTNARFIEPKNSVCDSPNLRPRHSSTSKCASLSRSDQAFRAFLVRARQSPTSPKYRGLAPQIYRPSPIFCPVSRTSSFTFCPRLSRGCPVATENLERRFYRVGRCQERGGGTIVGRANFGGPGITKRVHAPNE